MQPAVLNPVPRWRVVAEEQFRAVGLALRREALAAAGLVTLATLWMGYVQVNSLRDLEVPLAPEAGVPAAILALLVPMAVWKGEGPARRGYHRAMPVSHAFHAIARSLSGLVWLLAAVALYFVWLAGASAMTGGEVDAVYGWQWVVPFTGAAVMYLLGSALTLATTHPWRWLGGAFVAYMFLGAVRVAEGTASLFDSVNVVITGTLGLRTVVTGFSPSEYLYHHYGHTTADASVWLAATWLWLAIAVTAFAWAAFRQPER
ncbi:MAG TPA: hypothetical protein VFS20_23175 [Longimicrobium sp.]|nr:hypothetical protein [Longimicrobium sp.]